VPPHPPWRPRAPLVAAVFSHHHVDHIFGVGPFEDEAKERGWAPPRVYAHALIPANFERYRKTQGWNTAINLRQFELPPDRFRWPSEYRYPDVTYQQALTFTAGGLTFALRHARGETDDATWTWVPERRLLAPGDLFIWAVPNAGNPQKVQRFAGEWAAAASVPPISMATTSSKARLVSTAAPAARPALLGRIGTHFLALFIIGAGVLFSLRDAIIVIVYSPHFLPGSLWVNGWTHRKGPAPIRVRFGPGHYLASACQS